MTATVQAPSILRDETAGEFVCDFVSRLPTTDSRQALPTLCLAAGSHYGLLWHHGG